MRAVIAILAILAISGCAGSALPPINAAGRVLPCGVITDGLKDVKGKTRADEVRIVSHYERGYRAGCW